MISLALCELLFVLGWKVNTKTEGKEHLCQSYYSCIVILVCKQLYQKTTYYDCNSEYKIKINGMNRKFKKIASTTH